MKKMQKTGLILAAILVMGASAAIAQSPAKTAVDAAKAAGQVGEQSDGFLGLVSTDAPPTVRGAVAEINAGRAEAFREAAAKAGTDAATAAAAAAKQLIDRVPAGQYYKTADGRWVKK